MDDETRAALQGLAGARVRLPEGLHARLRGESLAAINADAERLTAELRPPQPRDEGGRFAGGAMNTMIRAAAGRSLPVASERPPGSFKTGQGGTASGRPHTAPVTMTQRIRAAAQIRGVATEQLAAALGQDLGESA